MGAIFLSFAGRLVQLGVAAAMLILLAAAEASGQTTIETGWIGVVFSIAVFVAMARTARALSRELERLNIASWRRRLAAVEDIGLAVLAAACAWVWKWPEAVRFDLKMDGWFVIDEAVFLSPIFIAAAAVELQNRASLRALFAALRSRFAIWGTIAFGLIALNDGLRFAAPNWSGEPMASLIYLPIAPALAILMPWLLCRAFAVRPLPHGDLRCRLERLAADMGVGFHDIMVWNTGGASANAVAAGFTRFSRVIILTDGLLAHFSDDEIDSVFRHELAHLKRRHLLWRVLTMLVPIAAVIGAAVVSPGWAASIAQILADIGIPSEVQRGLLLPLTVGMYGYLALGAVSKRCEFDADAWACLYDQPHEPAVIARRVAIHCQAIRKLTEFHGDDEHHRGWLHPSAAEREMKLVLRLPIADRVSSWEG